jgi:hypothetical protein
MALIELLRVRRMLLWHLAILAVITLAVVAFGSRAIVDTGSGAHPLAGVRLPLGGVVPLAMFFAAIFASSAGAAFNRENATRDISWTKPVSRTVFAVRIVAIDLAAITAMYVLALGALLLMLAALGIGVYADPTLAAVLATGLGVSCMWYALINLLTCMFGPAARAVGGVLWPIALLLLGLAELGGPAGTIVRALDVINPLAYMSGVSGDATALVQTAITPAPVALRPLIVFAFTVLFSAFAISIWPRKEA